MLHFRVPQQPPRNYFNTSDLYSLDVIDTLLAQQPPEAKDARKPLLAAKVYLEQSKINKASPYTAILDLCDTRLDLISCQLHHHEIIPAESEALQVTAACKQISKAAHRFPAQSGDTGSPDGAERTITRRCLRTHIAALDVLRGIDEQRGILARAARWREAQTRLEQKLAALES